MCGIVGLWRAPSPSGDLMMEIARMRDTLAHRGPDASGFWVDAARGLALGHRRLSIVDLSPEGAQPMRSACGRYVLVFNGEIYNHLDLRRRLVAQGVEFRGHSDTEVFLAACSRWGLVETLKNCNGMFALGLWDSQEHTLSLARDRLGKKPLYFGQMDGRLIFGSELKSLHAMGAWDAGIDEVAAAEYFRFGFVPGERSILRYVRKILPGYVAKFHDSMDAPENAAFWRLEEMIALAREDGFQGERVDAESLLLDRLRHAVELRCQADVPVGAFLSGGIDSSLVVALMAALGGKPVHTYTVGFADAGYDEAADARAIASTLGCVHREARLDPGDLAGLAASIPVVYDEPFADVSQIPTLLVSRLAREEVTVCLTGDGGDEVFGGYHRHFLAARLWPRISVIPWRMRQRIATLLRRLNPESPAAVAGLLMGMRTPMEKWGKLLTAMEAGSLEELYVGLLSHFGSRLDTDTNTAMLRPHGLPDSLGIARRVMAMDTLAYLPDDILVKTDRASMSVGLELRNPLLDVDVMELAWRLPEKWLVDSGQGKRILRSVLARYLPESSFDRPKMGFAVPIGDWLRGPLKAWAEALLLTGYSDEHLAPDRLRWCWNEHQSAVADHGHWLWRVLVWRSWREHWHV